MAGLAATGGLVLPGDAPQSSTSQRYTVDDLHMVDSEVEVTTPALNLNFHVNELDFMENGKGKGYWTFEATQAGTIATWRMEGDAGSDPVGRWFGFFIDGFVGPMFEDGLARLKKVSEG